ncbi:MAG: hypothetical protein IPK72_17835 [Candidatus Eisenbacteria bacterium]|nr:hypothetical protein [Candidatus Eisenbacteria bacterium]
MRELEYQRLKRQLELDYHRAAKQLEDEYRRNIEALDRVMALTSTNRGADGRPPVRWGRLFRTIEQEVGRLEKPFVVQDVIDTLALAGVPADQLKLGSISSALRRLEAKGSILIIERGEGRRATRYARKPPSSEEERATPELQSK